ncbi:hypothetical protein RIF23_09165 [Lipingzhangella sp. LS1_29]|uniref:ATP synthase protein I n=1 Tax=Lipingzhangella rawalii TaxID=2055835 RepID=A0ABU2H575_9ACTN|nr:hypothetical protein [Lipingzhangella rawalii]MDS1270463.1 hypothetical protein [Lipingzhangella rawalii]
MPEHDARILRGAAIPSIICGGLAVGVGALIAGTAGALGAAFAAAVVLGCFGLGQLLVLAASRQNPDLALPASALSVVLKLTVLGLLLVTLRDSVLMETLHDTVFAVTALLCVVVWLAAQARATARARIPAVVVDEERSL